MNLGYASFSNLRQGSRVPWRVAREWVENGWVIADRMAGWVIGGVARGGVVQRCNGCSAEGCGAACGEAWRITAWCGELCGEVRLRRSAASGGGVRRVRQGGRRVRRGAVCAN